MSSAAAEDAALRLDSSVLRHVAKPGEHACTFAVRLKNVSDATVEILQVLTSCGCSVAKLPSQPWMLPAGAAGEFQVRVEFGGKHGTFTKTATIQTRRGVRVVTLEVEVPRVGFGGMSERRQEGLRVAMVDRQAVFKGDCATCHVTPTRGLMGRELYAAACGICHDAEHRASIVPDLRALVYPSGHDYWRHIVRLGKPGTLMPSFARSEGGPLSDTQVDSLVAHLTATYAGAANRSAGVGPPPVDR